MQRRIVFGIALVFIVGVGGIVFAQSGSAAAFTDAGFTVINQRSEGGLPTWDLRDEEGRRFTVSVLGTFTDARLTALESLREVIYGLDGLEIERLRYVFERDRADAVVIPERFVIDGTDYREYMPSGMQFLFEDAVAFDFRLLVDNLAARINGQFLSEEQFLSRIQRAVANPAAYIQSQDPQFLARRLTEQAERIESLEFDGAQRSERDEELAADLDALESRGESALASVRREMRRAEQQSDAALTALESRLVDELQALTETVETEIQTLREALALVAEEKGELEAAFESLRRGSVVLASRSLFGSLKVVAPETIVRLVELRLAEPDLSVDEALSRVNGELPEGVEPLHKKHAQAIFALYFEDYE